MNRKPAIVIATTSMNPEPWAARFRALAPDRETIVLARPDQPVPDDHHLVCWKADPAIFRRSQRPRAIFSLGAGVDHILDAGPPEGVPIGRVVDPDLAARMAEYVTLNALWHFRRMSRILADQRARRWKPFNQPAARQVTVGLMGVGEMGQAAAAMLSAVGFRVVGWGGTARTGLPFESFHGAGGLDAFLPQVDILVALLPSTPQTRGIIDRALLARLRRAGPIGGPCLVSAGRGDAMVVDDVIACLRDGTLAAATLDVFPREPLPADSPFWGLENVIVTPHNAADSDPDSIGVLIVEEIARIERGEPLRHAVDPARGY